HVGAASTSRAWGAESTERWVWSTYAWMLDRRGPAFVRVTAITNLLGAAARAALLSVGARRRAPPAPPPHPPRRRGGGGGGGGGVGWWGRPSLWGVSPEELG